jgi:hypothetical protein
MPRQSVFCALYTVTASISTKGKLISEIALILYHSDNMRGTTTVKFVVTSKTDCSVVSRPINRSEHEPSLVSVRRTPNSVHLCTVACEFGSLSTIQSRTNDLDQSVLS